MDGIWNSRWISLENDPAKDLGVFAFRRRAQFERAPRRLEVRVSADQRYKLFVNDKFVGFGPQRGDVQHWFYDNYDIAPFLQEGENTLLALVWNFGWLAPMAQITVRTAFLLDDYEFENLSTPEDWEVAAFPKWGFSKFEEDFGQVYIDVGPGEIIGCHAQNDLEWRKPYVVANAAERGASGGGTPWMLIPRAIPAMKYELRKSLPVRRDGGDFTLPIRLGAGQSILLDYKELICAYPRILAEGEANLILTYAEALWQENGLKGNRNEIGGKKMLGYKDVFAFEEQNREPIEPLWWRCYRYLRIQADRPVTINSIDAVETGYPLQPESSFVADDPWVKPLWDVSVRTAQRCAGETYFDCPYYEQLQYAGDTRIQALIGYFLSPDRALQRAAIKSFDWSSLDSGLTMSRYPSRQPQIIPPFSFWYLAMLSDQRLYDRVPGISAQALKHDLLDHDFETLSNSPEKSFWNFGDWVPSWPGGVPPGGPRSTMHRLTRFYSQILNLSSAYCCDDEELQEELSFLHLDVETENAQYELEENFHRIGGLVRDEGEPPSEHIEALYRLCQIELGLAPDPWPFSALERENAAKCTYYFSYYKHLTMQPEDYLAQLGPWKEMIEDGLTTFAENPDPVRSDCHAWSAHPILGFFQIVAGVKSSAAGWRTCKIEPRPGPLQNFEAKIAHPDGLLLISYDSGRLAIDSPVPYELLWKGKVATCESGRARY